MACSCKHLQLGEAVRNYFQTVDTPGLKNPLLTGEPSWISKASSTHCFRRLASSITWPPYDNTLTSKELKLFLWASKLSLSCLYLTLLHLFLWQVCTFWACFYWFCLVPCPKMSWSSATWFHGQPRPAALGLARYQDGRADVWSWNPWPHLLSAIWQSDQTDGQVLSSIY